MALHAVRISFGYMGEVFTIRNQEDLPLSCMESLRIETWKSTRLRTVLLCLVTTALGGCWWIEQPGGSCMRFFPPFRQLLTNLYNAVGGTAVPALGVFRRWFIKIYTTPSWVHGHHEAIKNFMSLIVHDVPLYTWDETNLRHICLYKTDTRVGHCVLNSCVDAQIIILICNLILP